MDCSEFEPADLSAALHLRLFSDTGDTNSIESQPSSSRLPVASATNTSAPLKSFKEAVISSARLSASSFDCNIFEKGLAEAELSPKEHKQKVCELDRKAETLGRQAKGLNLTVYNVPENAEKDSQGADAFDSLLIKCMPDYHDVAWGRQRLGAYCLDQKRLRPVHMIFDTRTKSTLSLSMVSTLRKLASDMMMI